MISKSGLAVAKAASLPPTMKVSVPAAAPPTPPETGASRKPDARRFGLGRHGAGAVDIDGRAVESTAPFVMAGITSAATARRIAPLGSMVMTTSAPAAASAALAAVAAPSTVTPATSKPVTAWPAAARFAAIGAPMLPSPMNPIFMALSLLLECQCLRAERQEHGRDLAVAWPLHAVVPPLRRPVLVDDRRADAFEESRRVPWRGR
jgi:hypothetical protein